MTTFVDGTVPVAADFNGNFSALNQVCGTSTAITGYTAGDTLYASGTATLSKLPIGTTGQLLSVVAGLPAWASVSALPAYLLTPENGTFPTTNFPQLLKNSGTNWTDYTLDFDTTTGESAFWYVAIPAGVTFSGATIEFYSRQAAQTSGTLGWIVTSISRGDADAWDTAGVADTVTAATVKGTAGQVLRQSQALTVTNWAASRVLLVKITRDVANDTVSEDGKFIKAVLRLT